MGETEPHLPRVYPPAAAPRPLFEAHEAALAADGDPLLEQAATPDIAARLLPLPLEVLYELGFAPAVRLAAGRAQLDQGALATIADACWRAISQPAA